MYMKNDEFICFHGGLRKFYYGEFIHGDGFEYLYENLNCIKIESIEYEMDIQSYTG